MKSDGDRQASRAQRSPAAHPTEAEQGDKSAEQKARLRKALEAVRQKFEAAPPVDNVEFGPFARLDEMHKSEKRRHRSQRRPRLHRAAERAEKGPSEDPFLKKCDRESGDRGKP